LCVTYTVKNFGGKKFSEKAAAKDWQKTLLNVDLHNQSLIIVTVKQSQMKPFQTSMNIIK